MVVLLFVCSVIHCFIRYFVVKDRHAKTRKCNYIIENVTHCLPSALYGMVAYLVTDFQSTRDEKFNSLEIDHSNSVCDVGYQ